MKIFQLLNLTYNIIQFLTFLILSSFLLGLSSLLFTHRQYYIFYLQNLSRRTMASINHRPSRPLSRLDNNQVLKDINETLLKVVGIPEKTSSISKPFPILQIEESEKQNKVLMAPKKQEKINVRNQGQQNQHVFRRRVNSEISKLIQKLDCKGVPQKNKSESVVVAEHLGLPSESCRPFSQSLRIEDINQNRNRSLVNEQKSFARRVRERIEAENKISEEKKKRRGTIGQDAYLPFPIKELKQKIAERTRKLSADYQKAMIF